MITFTDILPTVHILPRADKLRLLQCLTVELQQTEYLPAIQARPGTPGQQLLAFAGCIPLEDLQQMQQTIAQDCRQVDWHEW